MQNKKMKKGKMAQNSRTLVPFSALLLCIFITSCVPKKEIRPEFLAQLGDSAFANQAPAEAEKLYLRAFNCDPKNLSIRLKLLRLYLHQKNFAAIHQHTDQLSLTPSTVDHLRIKAVAYDLNGNHVKAQKIYNNILKIVPLDRKTHLNLNLSKQLSY